MLGTTVGMGSASSNALPYPSVTAALDPLRLAAVQLQPQLPRRLHLQAPRPRTARRTTRSHLWHPRAPPGVQLLRRLLPEPHP